MARMALDRELRAAPQFWEIPADAATYEAKAGVWAGNGSKVLTGQSVAPAVTAKPTTAKPPVSPNYSAPNTIETIASAANAKRAVPAEITYSFDSSSLLNDLTDTAKSNIGSAANVTLPIPANAIGPVPPIVHEANTISNSGIVAISDLPAVTPATSGNISATNFNNSYALIDLTQQEQALASRIANQGDLKGANTEILVESVAQRQGLNSLPGGKYGSNNGFDHVFENADGSVTIILDSKQINNGAAKLSEGAGGQLQLTDAWVQAVLDRLDANSPAHIAVSRALQDGTLVKGVAGVDKTTGKLVVVRVN